VVGTGYHGSDNWVIAAENPGSGTVSEGYEKYNSIMDMPITKDTAAVIVEPVQLDLEGKLEQLLALREACTKTGTVLIFDEVITGFRFLDYSVSNHCGVHPDIICLGKALGNGYPIAIVGGREDIMETPGYFISNTHNGELSAIEASLKTLDFLTPEKLQELWNLGAWFQREFNAINPKIQIKGYATRGELQGDERFKAIFMQEMQKSGYLFGRAWFINFRHDVPILRNTLARAGAVCADIEKGEAILEGLMPRPIFKRN
jgi:glutamate-1-semialdehyde aminotransferase